MEMYESIIEPFNVRDHHKELSHHTNITTKVSDKEMNLFHDYVNV